jgi:hypothetical protein
MDDRDDVGEGEERPRRLTNEEMRRASERAAREMMEELAAWRARWWTRPLSWEESGRIEALLRRILRDGPWREVDVWKAVKEQEGEHFSIEALDQAKYRLNIVVKEHRDAGRVTWALPKRQPAPLTAEEMFTDGMADEGRGGMRWPTVRRG